MHAQLCPILFDPMDYSLPGSSVHGILDCHFLFQGIFLTKGLDPDLLRLLHPQAILYHLATWESMRQSLNLFCSAYLRPGHSPWLMKEIKYFTCMFLFSLFLEACGDPPRFKTMMLQGELKPNYRPGECVQYECRLGFKPKLPALPRSAVCQDNNTWSSLQDACVGK